MPFPKAQRRQSVPKIMNTKLKMAMAAAEMLYSGKRVSDEMAFPSVSGGPEVYM